MQISTLMEILGLTSVVIGLFVHINNFENKILSRFVKLELIIRTLLINNKIQSSRIADYEIFLEKNFNFSPRQHPNIEEFLE